MYRRGIVTEIDGKNGLARVEFSDRDQVVSWWLNVNQPAASKSRHYAMPDVGAQVNCLVDDKAEEGTILGAFYSDADRPPIEDATHQHVALEGGLVLDYDRATGALTISMPAGMSVATLKLDVTGPVEITGDVKINGRLDIAGAGITHNGADIGEGHQHTQVQGGIDLSGPPKR